VQRQSERGRRSTQLRDRGEAIASGRGEVRRAWARLVVPDARRRHRRRAVVPQFRGACEIGAAERRSTGASAASSRARCAAAALVSALCWWSAHMAVGREGGSKELLWRCVSGSLAARRRRGSEPWVARRCMGTPRACASMLRSLANAPLGVAELELAKRLGSILNVRSSPCEDALRAGHLLVRSEGLRARTRRSAKCGGSEHGICTIIAITGLAALW
jgi:hypothetical protein